MEVRELDCLDLDLAMWVGDLRTDTAKRGLERGD